MNTPPPTIAQLRDEGQMRLRRIISDQSRVAEILDIMTAEIVEREKRLQNADKDKEQ